MVNGMHRIAALFVLAAWGLFGWTQDPGSPLPPIQPSQARLIQTLTGLDGPGFSLAYNEAQGTLVAGCAGSQIQYWQEPALLGIRSGATAPRSIPAHAGGVTAVAWVNDSLLASAGADQRLLLWSVADQSPSKVLATDAGIIRTLATSPDGRVLASGGDDPVIRLWDVESGKLVRTLPGHKDWVMALAFSPDGKYLASAGYDQSVRIWNLGGRDKLPVIPILPPAQSPQRNYPLAVAFSSDGRQLAVGGTDALIRIYDRTNGSLIRTIKGHGSSVCSLIYHPGGKVLISASKDRTVRLWNPANGQLIKNLEGHEAWVLDVTLLRRGTMIASIGADGTVRIWDLRPTQ